MLTENFYRTEEGKNAMPSGREGSRQGSIDAPKLSTTSSVRRRNRMEQDGNKSLI